MPYNKTLGDAVTFTVEFFSSGVITVPSSADMVITYPPSSNSITTVSCTIGMTAAGQLFTATWSSSVAALGLSSYAATAPGITTGASGTSGTLRLIS